MDLTESYPTVEHLFCLQMFTVENNTKLEKKKIIQVRSLDLRKEGKSVTERINEGKI